MNRRRRRLSQQDLRAAGVTPGLMARRYDADGRARLEQLVPEDSGRPSLFLRPGSNARSTEQEKGDE